MASSDKVKGSAHRVIVTPGYHIVSQYDLRRTRQILAEKRSKKKGFSLMLAPMVDLFSILVIYLIMNFSTDGEIFFISHELTIPKAVSGQTMKSFPLISLANGSVMFDQLDSKGTMSEVNDQKNPQLRETLRRLKSVEEQISGTKDFKGQVNLQADVMTSAEDVKKVMRVLIDEGWGGINFVVLPNK